MRGYGSVAVRLHIFLTLALDGSQWPASCPISITSGGKAPSILEQKAGSDSEPVWMLCRRGKPHTLLGIEPQYFSWPAHTLVTIQIM